MQTVQTPLFQLNLMIWMTLPAKGSICPIFHKEDFELWTVGPALDVPAQIFTKAKGGGVPLKPSCTPEMVLLNDDRAVLLLVECKENSFGPEPTHEGHQVYQANALLSMKCPEFAEFVGVSEPEQWNSHLLYAVGGGKENLQQVTLNHLSDELRSCSINPVNSGAVGIYVRDDGVYLCRSNSGQQPLAALVKAGEEGVRVLEVEPGEDVRPLYLVPHDPSIDSPNEYEKKMLRERMRQELAFLLGSRADQYAFEFSLEEVLHGVYGYSDWSIWDTWQDEESKKNVRRRLRGYIREVITELNEYLEERDLSLHCEVEDGEVFRFEEVTTEVTDAIRRFLNSVAYRRKSIDASDGGQLNLWGQEEE